jgi:hypothetical protein
MVNFLGVEIFQNTSDQIHSVKTKIDDFARMHILNLKAKDFDALP